MELNKGERGWEDGQKGSLQSEAAFEILPHRLVGKVYYGNPLTTVPLLHAVLQGATSDEDEVPREVPEAEVDVVDVEASAAGESSSCKKRRPLCRWVP